jgi:very-short-patch-repair endonuclease
MPPAEVLRRLGGIADARNLLRHTTKSRVRTAMTSGQVVRDARGRYALPEAARGLREAHRLTGVASHLTAATLLGWEIKAQPELPTVTVPRNRRVPPERREGVDVRWADLKPEEVVDGRITAPGRTVMDCAKDLPFDEALAVADSAVRHGDLTQAELVVLAGRMPRRHRPVCLRVAFAANGLAANPFESVLRAIALDVPGLRFVPQVVIRGPGFTVRPDLVDERRRVVLEADSFEWHGSRSALRADCHRYNSLALDGWLVLRFAWEDVMFRPEYVQQCLAAAAQRAPVEHAVTRYARGVSA